MAGKHNGEGYEANRAISLGIPQASSPAAVPLKPEDVYHLIQLRFGSVEPHLHSPVHRHIVVLSTALPSAWHAQSTLTG
jgi:hypothetical protein